MTRQEIAENVGPEIQDWKLAAELEPGFRVTGQQLTSGRVGSLQGGVSDRSITRYLVLKHIFITILFAISILYGGGLQWKFYREFIRLLAFTRPKAGRPHTSAHLGAFGVSVAFATVPHRRLRATPPGSRVIGPCRCLSPANAQSSLRTGPCQLSQSGPFHTVFRICTH